MTKKDIQQKYAAEHSMFEIERQVQLKRPDDLNAVCVGGVLFWLTAVIFMLI